MTTTEAREIFNTAANAAIARGDHNAAADIEIVREYLTNPDFRKALSDYVWEINTAKEG